MSQFDISLSNLCGKLVNGSHASLVDPESVATIRYLFRHPGKRNCIWDTGQIATIDAKAT